MTASSSQLLTVYRAMLTARRLDEAEFDLVRRGEAFFHVSGAGHEASAALAPHLSADDWLHCHYRDKALLLLRGVLIRTFLTGLLCKASSPSAGRQMSAHLSDRARNVLSIVGPVGNNALQAVGVAAAVRDRPERPIVLCSVGDGTTQEGEFLEACAEAVRAEVPVLFLIEDNRWAISTSTSCRTFYSRPAGEAPEFYGMPIRRLDGRNVWRAYEAFGEVVARMRIERRPALVVLQVERLVDHTNADDQTLYRTQEAIDASRTWSDPIRFLEERLQAAGVAESALVQIQREAAAAVREAEAQALDAPEPTPIFTAKRLLPPPAPAPEPAAAAPPRLTMREALGVTLRRHLRTDPRVFLFGEDIEDPKGDVFGVTKGLSTEFPGRVQNAPLSEATIVGVAVGRALAGERPVAFLQFADFLPLAFNQIAAELGSLYWRTDGTWEAPVIVLASCGGYRPGLGPFHAQSMEAVAAHTPGLDVVLPCTAADAAGLLNAAFASGRPTLFFYPKALLNQAEGAGPVDVDRQLVPLGTARLVRSGRDLTLVGWGNTVALCAKAAAALIEAGVEAEVLDLRSLSPWDERAVLASSEKTRRLLVVHEDNHTCGFGAEVLATVAEKARVPIVVRRVARPDTHIPCNFANQLAVLPSFRSVLTAAATLLDLDLTWDAPPAAETGWYLVEAIGSGPADDEVRVETILVQVGATVTAGEVVALVEASKATCEIASPVAGVVAEVLARPGDMIAVGTPLLKVRTATTVRRRVVTQENPGTPRFRQPFGTGSAATHLPAAARAIAHSDAIHPAIGILSMAAVAGSRVVTNEELLLHHPGRTSADVIQRTGIETRRWLGPGEDSLSLAVRATRQALEEAGLTPADLDAVICSTGTPPALTPSLACRVMAELTRQGAGLGAQAYDINAACSGYLYALSAAFDYLQARPEARVLVVTAEALSPLLDLNDFDTAFLFGDAASATLLAGSAHGPTARAHLYRPVLAAKGEDGSALTVPLPGSSRSMHMKGTIIFTEAVRSMADMLGRACAALSLKPQELRFVVPHQANQRILDAVGRRTGVPIYSNLRRLGNTSSSSIPLALCETLPGVEPGARLGLCAFGGGFTCGAAVLEIQEPWRRA
jgi:2-oxoisovalerate dehydrogenase E1 component